MRVEIEIDRRTGIPGQEVLVLGLNVRIRSRWEVATSPYMKADRCTKLGTYAGQPVNTIECDQPCELSSQTTSSPLRWAPDSKSHLKPELCSLVKISLVLITIYENMFFFYPQNGDISLADGFSLPFVLVNLL